MVAEEERDLKEAKGYYQQALKIFQEFNDRYSQAVTYHQLGMVTEKEKDWREAKRYYKEELNIYQEEEERHSQARIYYQLSLVAKKEKKFGEAEEYYFEAVKITEEIGESFKPQIHLPSVKVEIDSHKGIFICQVERLRLKINNVGKEDIRDIVFQLDDTAKYSVKMLDDQREKTFKEIKRGEQKVIEYVIMVTEPGLITLQFKVNGEVYKKNTLEIIAVKDNPYFYGPPIKDTYYFFGRETELQTCLDNIIRTSGVNTMIIGEQRSGKTSLLNQIRDRLHFPFIPMYISFAGIERDEKSALKWLLVEVVAGLKESGHLEDKNYSISLEYSKDFEKYMKKILEDLKAVDPSIKIVLLLDEAHMMNEIDIKFQEVLRETFNAFIQEIRVILACYNDFFDELKGIGSPFPNIFDPLQLKPFEGEELKKLIEEPAKNFDYTFDEKAKKAVETISGGHPYHCQFLCAKSFNEAVISKTRIISYHHVKKAEKHVLENAKQNFKTGYWDKLKTEERLFLSKLANGETTPIISKKLINRLKKKSVIEESNGDYYFTSTLFKNWVNQLAQEHL
jgi:tetratricopeptide (TPR) repeat protein